VAGWGFLTSHARVLLCIAHDPGVRLRDIAVSLGITERSVSASSPTSPKPAIW
jgi:DNA-binding MarR family transcriptional regulator